MTDTDIIVCCAGGIGNRFYSLLSTHHIYLCQGIRFKYWWPIHKNVLEANITDLFESNQFEMVQALHPPKEGRYIKEKGDWVLDEVDLERDMPIYWDTPIARWHTDETLPSLKNTFDSLKIKKDILDKINSIDVSNRLGIHIRGGDLRGKNPHEDDTRFVDGTSIINTIKYINNILKENKDILLFGSCEDEVDKDILKQEFGSAIIQLDDCEHTRSSVQSTKDAFANLVLLSKCDTIVGNIGSSFAAIAAIISDKRYIPLT